MVEIVDVDLGGRWCGVNPLAWCDASQIVAWEISSGGLDSKRFCIFYSDGVEGPLDRIAPPDCVEFVEASGVPAVGAGEDFLVGGFLGPSWRPKAGCYGSSKDPCFAAVFLSKDRDVLFGYGKVSSPCEPLPKVGLFGGFSP